MRSKNYYKITHEIEIMNCLVELLSKSKELPTDINLMIASKTRDILTQLSANNE